MLNILLSLLLASLMSFAETELKEDEFYCVQLATSPELEDMKKLIKKASKFPDVRIERIGDQYTLRAGFFKDIDNAKRLLENVKGEFEDAFIRVCAYDSDRIVFPRREVKRRRYTYEVGMKLASLYLKKKDFERAEEIYRELLQFHPDSKEVRLQLARVLYWQGKYDEAIRLYKYLERFEPELINERRKVEISKIMKEVERLEKEGRLEEAIELLEKLYEEEKGNYDVGMKLGKLYIKVGQRKRAHRIFGELKRKYPEDKDIAFLYYVTSDEFRKRRKLVKKNLFITTTGSA